MVLRIVDEQEMVVEGALERDLEKVFRAFVNDPLVRIPMDQAREMYKKMIENTKEYLTMYDLTQIQ
jgi:alpha-galactosidase